MAQNHSFMSVDMEKPLWFHGTFKQNRNREKKKKHYKTKHKKPKRKTKRSWGASLPLPTTSLHCWWHSRKTPFQRTSVAIALSSPTLNPTALRGHLVAVDCKAASETPLHLSLNVRVERRGHGSSRRGIEMHGRVISIQWSSDGSGGTGQELKHYQGREHTRSQGRGRTRLFWLCCWRRC